MTTEQYQTGYEEGYQKGWNAALDEGKVFSSAPAPMSDDVLKKAARYDFLRDCDLDYMAEMYWPGGQVPTGDALDAVIDTARARLENT